MTEQDDFGRRFMAVAGEMKEHIREIDKNFSDWSRYTKYLAYGLAMHSVAIIFLVILVVSNG